MIDFESEFEYSNGADGSCQTCGDPTDEPWHAFCSTCYAEEQGWRPPDRDAVAWQHEDRERVTTADLLERLAELERRVDRLERARVERAA